MKGKNNNFKTVKGFIHTIDIIEHQSLEHLKGYDNLTDEQKFQLGCIIAGIGNELSELKDMLDGNEKLKIKWL